MSHAYQRIRERGRRRKRTPSVGAYIFLLLCCLIGVIVFLWKRESDETISEIEKVKKDKVNAWVGAQEAIASYVNLGASFTVVAPFGSEPTIRQNPDAKKSSVYFEYEGKTQDPQSCVTIVQKNVYEVRGWYVVPDSDGVLQKNDFFVRLRRRKGGGWMIQKVYLGTQVPRANDGE